MTLVKQVCLRERCEEINDERQAERRGRQGVWESTKGPDPPTARDKSRGRIKLVTL